MKTNNIIKGLVSLLIGLIGMWGFFYLGEIGNKIDSMGVFLGGMTTGFVSLAMGIVFCVHFMDLK